MESPDDFEIEKKKKEPIADSIESGNQPEQVKTEFSITVDENNTKENQKDENDSTPNEGSFDSEV